MIKWKKVVEEWTQQKRVKWKTDQDKNIDSEAWR
jgi:hypothetical protein